VGAVVSVRKSINEKMRHKVFASDNYSCRACGFTDDYGFGLACDHIVPVAAGGVYEFDNYQCLCATCNQIKKDKVAKILLKRTRFDTSISYQDAMIQINGRRQVFFKSIYGENKGWFGRRDKTLELIEKSKLLGHQRIRLGGAIASTFGLRKQVLDVAPYIKDYQHLVVVATPATIACALAY
jgi:hypothetical protein